MNSRERFVGTLTGQAVDRVPFIPVFGDSHNVPILPAWEKTHPGLKTKISVKSGA